MEEMISFQSKEEASFWEDVYLKAMSQGPTAVPAATADLAIMERRRRYRTKL